MKTPEQIAEQTIIRIYPAEGARYGGREDAAGKIDREAVVGTMDGNKILGLMAEAVEDDRAQRLITFDTLDHMLNAWDNYDGDVSGFMDAWLSHFNEGTNVPDWAKA